MIQLFFLLIIPVWSIFAMSIKTADVPSIYLWYQTHFSIWPRLLLGNALYILLFLYTGYIFYTYIIRKADGAKIKRFISFTLTLFIFVSGVALFLELLGPNGDRWGGVIGYFLSKLLVKWFGENFGTIIMIGILSVSFLIHLRFGWLSRNAMKKEGEPDGDSSKEIKESNSSFYPLNSSYIGENEELSSLLDRGWEKEEETSKPKRADSDLPWYSVKAHRGDIPFIEKSEIRTKPFSALDKKSPKASTSGSKLIISFDRDFTGDLELKDSEADGEKSYWNSSPTSILTSLSMRPQNEVYIFHHTQEEDKNNDTGKEDKPNIAPLYPVVSYSAGELAESSVKEEIVTNSDSGEGASCTDLRESIGDENFNEDINEEELAVHPSNELDRENPVAEGEEPGEDNEATCVDGDASDPDEVEKQSDSRYENPAPASGDNKGSLFEDDYYSIYYKKEDFENYEVSSQMFGNSIQENEELFRSEIQLLSKKLEETLFEFGIESKVTGAKRGPVVTMYEVVIAPGIKVNRITNLSDDFAMAFASESVRIVAPIPGKSAIGIEVPNRNRSLVQMGDLWKSNDKEEKYIQFPLGKTISGEIQKVDLSKMPHLLIAGATGSGKSVFVNTIITSLIYQYDPSHLRLLLIDPKLVELSLYNGIPHLLYPVITDAKTAVAGLFWVVQEMERRYCLLSELNVRDLNSYNEKVEKYISHGNQKFIRLPYLVILIDEFADLMMVSGKELEDFITRIAQKARAVGIHLVLATQRPSVNIITGIIKANFPARIAFQVTSKIDSRTILDQNGADKLLGKGDMLYQSPYSGYPLRVQGAMVSEKEVMSIVSRIKGTKAQRYIDLVIPEDDKNNALNLEDEDELFDEALDIILDTRKASASYLQRRLKIGYNRAARLIETMEERGFVSEGQGSKPREVLINSL